MFSKVVQCSWCVCFCLYLFLFFTLRNSLRLTRWKNNHKFNYLLICWSSLQRHFLHKSTRCHHILINLCDLLAQTSKQFSKFYTENLKLILASIQTKQMPIPNDNIALKFCVEQLLCHLIRHLILCDTFHFR